MADQVDKELEQLKQKYDFNPDGSATCKKCKADIMAVRQRRSVWEFPEMCAGSGRVVSVDVPYCPNCEPKPSEYGPPVTP